MKKISNNYMLPSGIAYPAMEMMTVITATIIITQEIKNGTAP